MPGANRRKRDRDRSLKHSSMSTPKISRFFCPQPSPSSRASTEVPSESIRLHVPESSPSSHASTEVPLESIRLHVPEPSSSSRASTELFAAPLEVSSVSSSVVVNEEVSTKIRQYSDCYIEFGFTSILHNGFECPQCVVCAKVLSRHSMKPSLLKRHLSGCHPELTKKDSDYFRHMLKSLMALRLDESGTFVKGNEAAVETSYKVALRIAKEKKPHTIGERLILPCCRDIIETMIGDKYVAKLAPLSLSDNTIKRRIDDIADDIKSQVISEIKHSAFDFFAIQLDESTDIKSNSQLMVFVKYMTDCHLKEEFLFCRPLNTTTSEDIFREVDTFFRESGLDWSKLCAVTTDGAPAMLGRNSGFQARVKAVSSSCVALHCMIHRYALASKTLPPDMHIVLKDVIAMVNYVKRSATNIRLFRVLCQELSAEHKNLLYYTQVRWLSAGNMLNRMLHLAEELLLFFQQQGDTRTAAFVDRLNDRTWMLRLSYMSDIFGRINIVNRSMQGGSATVLDFMNLIAAFLAKLKLWETNASENNFAMFDCFYEHAQQSSVEEVMSVQEDICIHLQSLHSEVSSYLPQIDDITLRIARNPFTIEPQLCPHTYQEELIDLQNDSFTKDFFETSATLSDFWCKVSEKYARVAFLVIKKLLMFPSTYLCESGFSSMVSLMSKYRTRLNIESDLRVCLSKTEPNIKQLTSSKQPQPSH